MEKKPNIILDDIYDLQQIIADKVAAFERKNDGMIINKINVLRDFGPNEAVISTELKPRAVCSKKVK